ncbi:MAG: T9SS type A sorting domain-containing protein [Bacteroidetes bacterium]|nr:T9SS type A sorting domain-containing protein [Bacteroidota bacterium]
MNKVVGVISCVCISFSGFAQDFAYKVERNIATPKVKTVSFSEIGGEQPKVYKVSDAAPAPWTTTDKLKSELDAKRQRRFKQVHNKYQEESKDIKPNVKASFVGLTAVPGVPNDNNMAISNDGKIISVVNSSFSILEEDGKYVRYYSLERIVDGQLPNLNRTYDPKVTYDPVNDRFILVYLQGSTSADTRIIVGFSESNDPEGDWNFYAVDGNPFIGKTWSDYPIIGQSKDDLFITVNVLRDGESWQEGFTQSVIWQIDKNSGYAGNDTIYEDLWYDLKYNDKPLWSICAVQGGSEFTSPNMQFLSVRPGDASNDSIFLHEITDNRLSGNAQYDLRVLQSNKLYGVPPSAYQPDPENLLQTNDTRVLSAISEDGYIQYVQSTVVPETGVPGIYHGFLNIESGKIDANYITSDTFEYAYPSIAFAGNADFPHASVITFSHSSELDYPGTSAVLHNRVVGQKAIFSPVVQIKQGELSINRLTDSLERWGDYTGIQTKYNEEGVVWMSGSYGRPFSQGSSRGRNGVQVGAVKVNNMLTVLPDETKVLLLPNPVEEKAVIQFESEKDQVLSFNIYTTDGKLVQELLTTPVERGLNEISFPTVELMQGMYYIQVIDQNDERVAEVKFVVL